jgi:DNA-binding IscR family transcriptional regulator
MSDEWGFLSNHGLVLLALARQPDLRLREVAAMVGITERAAQELVNSLVASGYVERVREGRRNRYLVHGELPLHHPMTAAHPAAHLIGALTSEVRTSPREGRCTALVLACSDYRYQEILRQFLATEGLLGRAEVLLWPGGGAALAGPDRQVVLAEMRRLVEQRAPERLLLVAHQDCTAEGGFRPRADVAGTYRALARQRRAALAGMSRTLGLSPELWYSDIRRTRRLVVHERSPKERSRHSAA